MSFFKKKANRKTTTNPQGVQIQYHDNSASDSSDSETEETKPTITIPPKKVETVQENKDEEQFDELEIHTLFMPSDKVKHITVHILILSVRKTLAECFSPLIQFSYV